jgi:hypothetical protein
MFAITLVTATKTYFYTKSAIELNDKKTRWSEDFKFGMFFSSLEDARFVAGSILRINLYPFNVLNIDVCGTAKVCIVPIVIAEPLEMHTKPVRADFLLG